MKMKKEECSKEYILKKLMWFHGEEFEKYPLNDDFKKLFCIK